MRWGLYSRVAVSLGVVLFAAMVGLALVLLRDVEDVFHSAQAANVALVLTGFWLLSMMLVLLVLGASLKPLSSLSRLITSASFDSPQHKVNNKLRARKDEVGVLACAFDAMMANLQKSYDELEQRESHYRQLIETANAIPWELDLNMRKLTYVGPQVERILGYEQESWLEDNFWLEHVFAEDLQAAEDFYRRVAAGKDESEMEYRILHADGHPVWVRDWVHRSFQDPRAPKIQGFTFDVDERVNARLELQRYREHLEKLVDERTAELVEVNKELQSFAHSLSQDLRVPLRIVNGFSQALMEDYADTLDEQGKDYLHRICLGTEAMGKMISDMLLLSRVTREEMHRKRFSLSEVVEKEFDRLRKSDPDRKISVSIQPDVMVYADQSMLQIVIENLLSNAWKYTAHTSVPEIKFSSENMNNKTIYSVSDNGAGFDMQYADKLFLPFRRLHNSKEFEGTGVGLATVKRIILRHGGDIWGEGSVGEGAVFSFTLSKEVAPVIDNKNNYEDMENHVA